MRRRSLEQFQQLFAVSRDLLAIIGGTPTRVIAVNPSWERVLGYPPDALVGTDLMELVHPDDREATRRGTERLLRDEGYPQGFENRYRHADGQWVWLRWTSVTRKPDGYVYTAAHDVTEERRAAEEARATLARLEEAQRVAHLGSWEVDLQTGERFYTAEMYVLHGMDPERDGPWSLGELIARTVPEDRDRLRETAQRALGTPGRQQVEFHLVHAPHRVLQASLEVEQAPDGTPLLMRGTTQDVTELRENERRLAEAERLAGIGSWEWRRSDERLVWSPGTYRLYGLPQGAPVTADLVLDAMDPAETTSVRRTLNDALQALGSYEIEYSIPPGPGERRVRHITGRGEAYRSGDDTFLRGTIADVTRSRRAARQSQEIARLGQAALERTDLKVLFEDVCHVIARTLDTDMTNVLALQSDGSFAFAISFGFPGTGRGTAIAAGQDSIARRAVEADAPMVVDDWLTEERFPYSEPLRAGGVRSTAVLPIRGPDEPFGVLTTHARAPGMIEAEDFAFLDALATFLATAIERLRHEAEIAGLAALRGRLVAENLEAEERVRRRISEQLHDGALQDLLAARQDLVEAGGPDPATRDEMLGFAREGVERAVRRLREAVHALHPVVLQHGGLEAAMQAAADQAARQGSFTTQVAVDPDATGLRDELVMSLARELLNNCAKHADAQAVRVAVRRDDGAVVLEVADDGCGLDLVAVAEAPMNGHIGLASLAHRVEAVGGTLDLQAAAGGGTTVRAKLPIG
jgi:PAS domain S-box-containing protein